MIGIGVIGYGYWGPNLVRNFTATPGAHVVTVCDVREERLALARQQYGVGTTTDHREVIADSRVDCVVIATPVSTHFDLAMQAMQAAKHVLIEKPMALNVEQAMRLVEEAERRALVLMVDHTFIYTGAVRKIKELLSSGEMGQVYYYDSVRVNLGLFQDDVDVIWDLATHDLAIMDYVLSIPPEAISATGVAHVPGHPEDVAYISIFFPDNVIAHLHVNWLAPVKLRRTLIGCSKKMIVYDDLEPSEKIRVYDKGIWVNQDNRVHELRVGYRSGDVWLPKLDGTEALAVEARHLIDCIENGSRPLTDGLAGLRVVRLLAAATQSMRARGQIIELKQGSEL
jgi:predicted dehydrogenase